MICPECGGAELVYGARDFTYTYRGQTMRVENAKGEWCPLCGEGLPVDKKEGHRWSNEMLAFNMRVNAELVDPAFIVSVRQKLKLDQRQAADLFGGGVNAFSRYESGKVKPPLALVQLFRLLDRHPDLIGELARPASHSGKS